jgi:hypothetical protein
MIPIGYMAKRVEARPEWLKAAGVVDLYSVSGCISRDFADYIPYWKHNGYWFFDSPRVITQAAGAHSIDLSGTKLFYYEAYERAFDVTLEQWVAFEPEPSFATNVAVPAARTLEGYDVVAFNVGTSAECSPLSCNGLAAEIETNQHCLLRSLEEAQQLLESGRFDNSEPGPFRILAVYSAQWAYPLQAVNSSV